LASGAGTDRAIGLPALSANIFALGAALCNRFNANIRPGERR
jgi:hypothetical protein